MAEARLDLGIFDRKIFGVTFIFGAIAGLEALFNVYLRVSILRYVGTVAFGVVNLLLSGIFYVLYPVLYFVVLYLYCGGPLLNRMARVLISIVLGSILGCWVGFLTMGAVTVAISELSVYNAYANLSLFLPQYVIGQVLASFGILAFSDLVPKWRESVKVLDDQSKRPRGLVILVALYVVLALLNTLVIPILEIHFLTESPTALQFLELALLVAALTLPIIGQLVLAAGLYRGRKWAWLLSVISSATGVLLNISAIGLFLASGPTISTSLLIVMTALFAGFLISLAIFSYLMSTAVRIFFRFVNQIE